MIPQMQNGEGTGIPRRNLLRICLYLFEREIKMDMETLLLIVSMSGNAMQLYYRKKGDDIVNLTKQVDLMRKLNEESGKRFESELKWRDEKIAQLESRDKDKNDRINELTLSQVRTEGMVSKMIGDSCEVSDCRKRKPYPIEKIQTIIRSDKVIGDD